MLAVVDHLLYAALFVAIFTGFWRAKAWAPNVVYGTTALVTLDKLLYVLDARARAADFAYQTRAVPGVLDLLDAQLIDRVVIATSMTVAACWWGFALYIYLRRSYFARPPSRLGLDA